MNIEKVRKHRNIKLVSTEKRRDYLVQVPMEIKKKKTKQKKNRNNYI